MRPLFTASDACSTVFFFMLRSDSVPLSFASAASGHEVSGAVWYPRNRLVCAVGFAAISPWPTKPLFRFLPSYPPDWAKRIAIDLNQIAGKPRQSHHTVCCALRLTQNGLPALTRRLGFESRNSGPPVGERPEIVPAGRFQRRTPLLWCDWRQVLSDVTGVTSRKLQIATQGHNERFSQNLNRFRIPDRRICS